MPPCAPRGLFAMHAFAPPSAPPAIPTTTACVSERPKNIVVAGGRGTARLTALAVERRGGRALAASTAPVTDVDGAVFAVGAGDECGELRRWAAAVAAFDQISAAKPTAVGVFVTRQLCCAEVQAMLARVRGRWIVVRPGALVDGESEEGGASWRERVLLTTDVRPNGLVSRAFVAEVLAVLALDDVGDVASVPFGCVAGLYDTRRMIIHPRNTTNCFTPIA